MSCTTPTAVLRCLNQGPNTFLLWLMYTLNEISYELSEEAYRGVRYSMCTYYMIYCGTNVFVSSSRKERNRFSLVCETDSSTPFKLLVIPDVQLWSGLLD